MLLSQMLIKDNAFHMFVDASVVSKFVRNSIYKNDDSKINVETILEEDNPYIVKLFIKD